MQKFFDSTTKTLFITKGTTKTSDLSDNSLIEIADDELPLAPPKLRRQHAGPIETGKHYITGEGKELSGHFDINDSSNSDLEEVSATIYCP